MEDEVLLQMNGAVAEVVLNRPKKLNAVTPGPSPMRRRCSNKPARFAANWRAIAPSRWKP